MSFEEFLHRRLAELVRFAHVLCGGDTARAEGLVADVLVRAFPHWDLVLAAGRPYAVLRTAVVRARLADPAPGSREDAIARADLALALYSGQTPAEVAAVVGTSAEEVEAELVAARERAADSGAPSVAASLDLVADEAAVDEQRIASEILDRLESDRTSGQDLAFHRLISVDGPPASHPASHPASEQQPDPDPQAPVAAPAAPRSPVWVTGDPDAGRSEELAEPDRPRRYRRPTLRQTALPATMIAAAVIVCVLVAGRAPGTASEADTVPAPVRTVVPGPDGAGVSSPVTHPLPGTKVLDQFYGSGPMVVDGGRPRLATGRELAISGVCSGPGGARIGPVTVVRCDGSPVGATVTPEQVSAMRVTAASTTTWHFALVDEPAHGTNGSLQYPVSPLLTSASLVLRVASAAGSGDATVPLTSSSTSARVENLRLLLTCTGTGVSLSSADHTVDGSFTTTCFRGWSYEFDVSGALVPGSVTVDASAGTSWRLVVVRA